MVSRFKDGVFVYPGALFQLTPAERKAAAANRHARSGTGWVGPVTGEDGEDDGAAGAEGGGEDEAGFDNELSGAREAA